ncbi:hypothetical protein Pmani_035976 [Petrolisthes manimaculis]|uniref:Uncharacterized protein n=1 Tax=Petrolisthes manimaculis TaxID=1843537 RepID=A0AAE1NLX2_9EUCA|nr:hypothetical protein Pmani_035976 [Petrolisthes manimaculis]
MERLRAQTKRKEMERKQKEYINVLIEEGEIRKEEVEGRARRENMEAHREMMKTLESVSSIAVPYMIRDMGREKDD